VFLMASKKRPKNKTSNYLISMGKYVFSPHLPVSPLRSHLLDTFTLLSYSSIPDQNDLNRTGRGYLGKLRSNFVGTEFQVIITIIVSRDIVPLW